MAITINNLTTGKAAVSFSSPTASITTVTGKLYLMVVTDYSITGTPSVSSGLGLTWTKINATRSGTYNGTSILYYAVCTAGSTGTLTVSGTSRQGVAWNIDVVTGASTTNPIRQSTGSQSTTSPLTQSLSAFVTDSYTYMFAVADGNNVAPTMSAEAGYTTITNNYSIKNGLAYLSEYKTSSDTSPSISFANDGVSPKLIGWSLEIQISIPSNLANGGSTTNTIDVISSRPVQAGEILFAVIGCRGGTTGYFVNSSGTGRINWTLLQQATSLNGIRYSFYKGDVTVSGTVNLEAWYNSTGGCYIIDSFYDVLLTNTNASCKSTATSISPVILNQNALGGTLYTVFLADSSGSNIPPILGTTPTGYTPVGSLAAGLIRGGSFFKADYSSSTSLTWSYGTNGSVLGFGITLGQNTSIGIDPTSYSLTNNDLDVAVSIDTSTYSYTISNKPVIVDIVLGINSISYSITNQPVRNDAQYWINTTAQSYSVTNQTVQNDAQKWLGIDFTNFFIFNKTVLNDAQTQNNISAQTYTLTNNDVTINKVFDTTLLTYTVTNQSVDRSVILDIDVQNYTITNQIATFQFVYETSSISYGILTNNISIDPQKWIAVDATGYTLTNQALQINAINNIGIDLLTYSVTHQIVDVGYSIIVQPTSFNYDYQILEVIGNTTYIEADVYNYSITNNDVQINAINNIGITKWLYQVTNDNVQTDFNKNIVQPPISYTWTLILPSVIGNISITTDVLTYSVINQPVHVIAPETNIDINVINFFISGQPVQIDRTYDINTDLLTYDILPYPMDVATGIQVDIQTYSISNQQVTRDAQKWIVVDQQSFTLTNRTLEYGYVTNTQPLSYGLTFINAILDNPTRVWVNSRHYVLSMRNTQVNAVKNIGINAISYGITTRDITINRTSTFGIDRLTYTITNSTAQIDAKPVIVIKPTSFGYKFRTINIDSQRAFDVLPTVFLSNTKPVDTELQVNVVVDRSSYTITNKSVLKDLQKAFNINTGHINVTNLELLVAENWIADTFIDVDKLTYQCTNDPLFVAALNEDNYPEYRIYVSL